MTDDKKRRVYARIFAFLAPGAGHAIHGRWLRGSMWCTALLTTILAVPFIGYGYIAMFVVSIGCIVDAWRLTSSDRAVPVNRALWLGIALSVGAVLLATGVRAQYALAFKVPSGSMIPTLNIDDHVWVFKPAYWFSEPKRGDVIAFRLHCNDLSYIKRVIAIAGDEIEVRCRKVYVNGKALARSRHPGRYMYKGDGTVPGEMVKRVGVMFTEASYKVIHHPFPPAMENESSFHDFPRREYGHDTDKPVAWSSFGCKEPPARQSLAVVVRPKSDDKCAQTAAYKVPSGHLFVMGDNRDNSSDSRHWGPLPESDVLGKVTAVWWAGPGGKVGRIR